jgi:hypothetical protein
MKFSLPICSAALLMAGMGVAIPAMALLGRSSAIATPTASNSMLMAQSGTPITYLTSQTPDTIAIQIQDGEFFYHGTLTRSYGNLFSGTDGRVRVNYDLDSQQIVVFNTVTGDEFYNYTYPLSGGSASQSSGSQSSSSTPTTYMTPQDADTFMVQITEGEFRFRGPITRTSGSTYVGSDGRVRVIYDETAGRVVVINAVTGTEFYNYSYSYR